MHTGRISHPDNTPHHHTPVAPSAVQPKGVMFTATGPQEMPVPRALTADEIAAVVDPDLPHCLRTGAPLNEPDPATFYGGDHRGCTDYPTLPITTES